MRINTLALVALLLVNSPAYAQKTIEGFQDFTFGMSLYEVRDRSDLSEEDSSPPMDQYFGTNEPILVAGDKYDLGFGFSNDTLINVTLSRWPPAERHTSDIICRSEFDSVFGMIQGRYGNPDQDPEQRPLQFGVSLNARFTDADGAYILLAALTVGASCIVNISYNAAPEGGSGF